ncbi:hypothetical protein CLOP_g18082 [Closterium sp. NIES-67]|nr:hypothetical protein CLOP_g18082 [Closterium sp. NIES-67]
MPVDADFRSCARQCEDTYRNTRAYQFDHADDYSEDSSISDGYDDGEDVEDDDDDDIGGSSNEETDLEGSLQGVAQQPAALLLAHAPAQARNFRRFRSPGGTSGEFYSRGSGLNPLPWLQFDPQPLPYRQT